jgi:hypothetical protein
MSKVDMSEMRTDESYHEDDVSELTEWNGYTADSSSDEVSSEDPLPVQLGEYLITQDF